jgi:hypothetical protein
MSPLPTRHVALSALLCVAVLGCALDPATRLRYAQQEQQRIAREMEGVDRQLQAQQAYLESLRNPGQAPRSFSMYYSPAALEQLASRLMPIRMPAREFHPQASGTIIIERLYDIRFVGPSKLTCKLFMRGENVGYTGSVPSSYAGQIRMFQQGVAAGVDVDLDVQLTLEGTTLGARAQATDTRLRANRGSRGESMLQSEMNKRALRASLLFDLNIPGSPLPPRHVVVTPNNLVVTYMQ